MLFWPPFPSPRVVLAMNSRDRMIVSLAGLLLVAILRVSAQDATRLILQAPPIKTSLSAIEPSAAQSPTDSRQQLLPSAIHDQQTTTIPDIGRPILFVHGWCGNDLGWQNVLGPIAMALATSHANLYPTQAAYLVIYNGSGTVWFYDFYSRLFVQQSQVSRETKFFLIDFYDARQSTFYNGLNQENVAQIPIAVKGNEVAKVLAAIQDVTFAKDITVVAHSMGGLDTRALLEGLASPLYFDGTNYLYQPGDTNYQNNIRTLITIDTPHKGAQVSLIDSIVIDLAPASILPCFSSDFNLKEMDPQDPNTVIGALNYTNGVTYRSVSPKQFPSQVNLYSIVSYNTDVTINSIPSDRIVDKLSQDITFAIPAPLLTNQFKSIDNSFGVDHLIGVPSCDLGLYVLHLVQCVGAQPQTLNEVYPILVGDLSTTGIGTTSLSFDTPSAYGGTKAHGTVVLSTVAPPNGASVSFSGDNPSVFSPGTLQLAGGVQNLGFNLTLPSVTSLQTVNITASYGRGSATAQLTVKPAAPELQTSGVVLDFGNQLYGHQSAGRVVNLTNVGVQALTIASISISGEFAQSNNCPVSLDPGGFCSVNVEFAPSGIGARNGLLVITSNAPDSPRSVALTGNGFDIAISLSRPSRPKRSGTETVVSRTAFSASIQTSGLTSGAIALGCSVVPAEAECSVTPAVVLAQNSRTTPATVVVDLKSSKREVAKRLRERQVHKLVVIVSATVSGVSKSMEFPVSLE